MKNLKTNWCLINAYFNKKGIPAPMIRDPKSGRGSVSLTMVFISFNVWLLSLIGMHFQVASDAVVDSTFNMVIACFGLYFGRKFSTGRGVVNFGDLEHPTHEDSESPRPRPNKPRR